MSIAEALKARKAQQEAEQAALDAVSPKIETGVEGSAAQNIQPAQAEKPESEIPDNLMDNYPEHTYLLRRVKRIILKDGTAVKPDTYGLLSASSDELKKELEHFAKQGPHMAERLK